MAIYRSLRPLLFATDPETAHDDPAIYLSYSLNNNDANGVGGACNRTL